MFNTNQKGILTLEIVIAVALISVALIFFLGLAAFSLKISDTSIKKGTMAIDLAQEAIEAARNFRENNKWNVAGLGTLTLNSPYHPEKTGSNPPTWNLVANEETINGFNRKIVFNEVMRDGSGNIASSGGTVDLDTKKVTATVSWGNKKVEIITYLTNWRNY